MVEEKIEMRFMKDGLEVRKKVKMLGNCDWHTVVLDYQELSGKNLVNIESVEPTIVDGELKSLELKGEDIKMKKSNENQMNEPPRKKSNEKIVKGIIIKGEVISCDHLYELLVESANWLIKKGYLTEDDLPVDYGGQKRYLINDENEKKFGGEMNNAKKLDNGWYIETKFSAGARREKIRWLLEEFGLDENEYEIKWS